MAARPISLDASDLLAARFDALSSGPQLLALVSPTCAVCLDGVEMILQGLDEPAGEPFRAHVVWTPVLDGDTEAAAVTAASDRDGQRVDHYWDGDRTISAAAHAVLDFAALDRTVAWDVYLLFRAGTLWTAAIPKPFSWLHQLRLAEQTSLDANTLRVALREATS
jgi:hypothetical protein